MHLPLWLCWDLQFHFKDDKPIVCTEYLFILSSSLHGWGAGKNEQLLEGYMSLNTTNEDLII